MLSESHRRLWRRRLRRRPLLPFLIAATVAVDGVLLFSANGDDPYANGLVAGQIGLLGAWITWSPRGVATRGFLSIAAVIAALAMSGNLQFEPPEKTERIVDNLAGINSAVVFASLAATTLGAAIARLINGFLGPWFRALRRPVRRRRLRIGALLWTTALVAVAIGFGRTADWDILAYVVVATLIAADAFIAGTAVLIATAPLQWVYRVAVVIGLAVACLLILTMLRLDEESHLLIYFVIQFTFLAAALLALEPRMASESAEAPPPRIAPPPPEEPKTIDIRI